MTVTAVKALKKEKREKKGRRDCSAVRRPLGTPLLRRPQLSGHQEPQVTPHRPQDQAPGTHWVRTGRKPRTHPYTYTHAQADTQTDRHTDRRMERERERELRRHKTTRKHTDNMQGKLWPIFRYEFLGVCKKHGFVQVSGNSLAVVSNIFPCETPQFPYSLQVKIPENCSTSSQWVVFALRRQ